MRGEDPTGNLRQLVLRQASNRFTANHELLAPVRHAAGELDQRDLIACATAASKPSTAAAGRT